MSNKASEFAENLAVVSNITALSVAALQKVGNTDDVELNAASRDLLVQRIQKRIAHNLRNKPTVQ
mgnify:CR=1 FL=1